MLLADINVWNLMWSMLWFFFLFIWILILVNILIDLFRDHTESGGMKALWCLFLIFLPFLAVFVYLIARGKGMAERSQKQQQQAQSRLRQLRPAGGRQRQPGRPDRQGQGAARRGHHHPGGVRLHEGQGAQLIS